VTVTELGLSGVLHIEPDVYHDDRGFFLETWNEQAYREHGLDATFVQDNLSRSDHGVLRGLHYQDPHPQGKLVSVLQGEVYDVAVDLRKDSDTFGESVGATLSAENGHQLYVPEGFAHGFLVTGETALFHYKCTDFYHPETEGVLRWDDPALDIHWPVEPTSLSERDASAPFLEEIGAVASS
jgi:dTDP-4-dehydrorhamnose 3,5-epimerase